jgi:hypothetical protein
VVSFSPIGSSSKKKQTPKAKAQSSKKASSSSASATKGSASSSSRASAPSKSPSSSVYSTPRSTSPINPISIKATGNLRSIPQYVDGQGQDSDEEDEPQGVMRPSAALMMQQQQQQQQQDQQPYFHDAQEYAEPQDRIVQQPPRRGGLSVVIPQQQPAVSFNPNASHNGKGPAFCGTPRSDQLILGLLTSFRTSGVDNTSPSLGSSSSQPLVTPQSQGGKNKASPLSVVTSSLRSKPNLKSPRAGERSSPRLSLLASSPSLTSPPALGGGDSQNQMYPGLGQLQQQRVNVVAFQDLNGNGTSSSSSSSMSSPSPLSLKRQSSLADDIGSSGGPKKRIRSLSLLSEVAESR